MIYLTKSKYRYKCIFLHNTIDWLTITDINSVFTHVASIYANLLEQKKAHNKRVHLHWTGLGQQHGRRFIVLGHQYVRRDVM